MTKKKEISSEMHNVVPVGIPFAKILLPQIEPLTQEFGNGDLNVLRDKINEIIKSR